MPQKGAVVAISSQVSRGHVGNRAMVFALERLGFEVWAAPTIMLPFHPGHGRAEKIVIDPDRFAGLLGALVQDKRGPDVAGIVSGYFASVEQVHAVASLVARVKSLRPDALYLCDPVIGDDDGLYVDAAIAGEIRDQLVPLADLLTPNAFELRWLHGADAGADLVALARGLTPPVVLVTTAPSMMRGQIGNLLVTRDDALLFEHPIFESAAKGTGDLLAALFLGRRLRGESWEQAAAAAIGSVADIVAGSAKENADELLVAALQDSIAEPWSNVSMRRLGAGVRK